MSQNIGLSERTVGGEEEDRTPDLRIANATLSQLSYPPTVLKSIASRRAVSERVFELSDTAGPAVAQGLCAVTRHVRSHR